MVCILQVFQGIILAILQGIVEWLPISSEGQLVLVLINLMQINIIDAIALALLFHIGTAMVVIVQYTPEVANEFKIASNEETKELLSFYLLFFVLVTLGTAITAIPTLIILEDIWNLIATTYNINLSALVTAFIGIALIFTGFLLSKQNKAFETIDFRHLGYKTIFFLGLVQGFAAIPGISRSGVTLTFLLLIGMKKKDALKASFLASIPAALGATALEILRGKIQLETATVPTFLLLHLETLTLELGETLFYLLVVFIVGLLSIKALLRVAQNVNFSQFCYFLGAIALIGGIIAMIL